MASLRSACLAACLPGLASLLLGRWRAIRSSQFSTWRSWNALAAGLHHAIPCPIQHVRVSVLVGFGIAIGYRDNFLCWQRANCFGTAFFALSQMRAGRFPVPPLPHPWQHLRKSSLDMLDPAILQQISMTFKVEQLEEFLLKFL